MCRILLAILSMLSQPLTTTAFTAPSTATASISLVSSRSIFTGRILLEAKKSGSSAGRGFGKSSSSTSSPKLIDDDNNDDILTAVAAETNDDTASSRGLESIATNNFNSNDNSLSSTISPEERSASLLRNKFNLKSYEEQKAIQGDERLLIASQKKAAQRDKLRNIEKLWPEDKDLFQILPPSLLKGIDSFLKLGLAICTVLFLGAGVFITTEAWSKATGNTLPLGLEDWVVDVVEPNFTPLLGVLLGFSVLLGLFSAGQLGSKGSVYKEDP